MNGEYNAIEELAEEEDEIEALNKKYYELYSELHDNSKFMPPEQTEYMAQTLSDLYRWRREAIDRQYAMERDKAAFVYGIRYDDLVPQEWKRHLRWRSNAAAKLAAEAVRIETDAILKEREEENDENRPEYMAKTYLTRADKRKAKREARRAARDERKAEKKKQKRLRDLEAKRKQKTQPKPSETGDDRKRNGE